MAMDLNLLRTFTVIMKERSVTKAAEQLHLGQPAVSANLARLRSLFGDPLLIRQGRSLVPTPRGLELYGEILEPLATLEAIAKTRDRFDAQNYAGAIKIGLSDDLEFLSLPHWAAHFARSAPQLRLIAQPTNFFTVFDALKKAEIAVAITSDMPSHPDWAGKMSLGAFPFRILYDEKVSAPIKTLAAYTKATHIRKSFGGQSVDLVDKILAQRGQKRHVGVTVSHFSSVPMLVRNSANIATAPAHVADFFAREYGLKTALVPFDIPDYSLALYWHSRIDGNEAELWFRNQLQKLPICP